MTAATQHTAPHGSTSTGAGILFVEGVVLILFGVAAIAFPLFASIAAAVLLGWILIASGHRGPDRRFHRAATPAFRLVAVVVDRLNRRRPDRRLLSPGRRPCPCLGHRRLACPRWGGLIDDRHQSAPRGQPILGVAGRVGDHRLGAGHRHLSARAGRWPIDRWDHRRRRPGLRRRGPGDDRFGSARAGASLTLIAAVRRPRLS